MLLNHIHRIRIFRFLSFVLILSFSIVQIPVSQAGIQYQQESGTYKLEKPVDLYAPLSTVSNSDSNLPNPNHPEDNPLSTAFNEPGEAGASSTISFSGSIQVNSGDSYTNQREVVLQLQASGGRIQGDYDSNGIVDAADYTAWRNHYGASGGLADYNQDGRVDAGDYVVWRNQFGATNGVTKMSFSSDNSNWSDWENYQAVKNWLLPDGDGFKTIYVKFRDAFGNESEVYSATITLDTTPPSVTQILGPALTNTDAVTLMWQGMDQTSSITGYRWRLLLPDETLTDWTESSEGEVTLIQEISQEGDYEFQVQVQDVAGFWSVRAVHFFTIDRTAPSAILTSPTVTGEAAYTLTYTVIDNHDGEYVVTESIMLNQGFNLITRTLTDQAGNSQPLEWTVSFLPVTSINQEVYQARFIPFGWVQTTTPTGIVSDDAYKSFTLPFSFNFFGNTHTQVQVSSNGFVQFGSCSACTDFSPDIIPNSFLPNNIAAPLWRDLDLSRGGSVTYLSTPTQFVVSWENAPDYIFPYAPQRFQIILESNGNIIFQYDTITSGPTTSVGLENSTGTQGIRYTLLPANRIAVKFFTSPLEGSVLINGGDLYALSPEILLTLTGFSSESALDAMRFSTDGGQSWTDWEPFNTEKSLVLPNGDGTKEVQFQLRDLAGNIATFVDTIILDTAAPTGAISINEGAVSANSRNVHLILAGSDAGSGLDGMRFSTDGGNAWSDWEVFSAIKSINLPLGDGVKEVQYQLRDKVGYIAAFSDTIVLDTTVPPFLQDQNLGTKQGVRKPVILGPLTDTGGNSLTYSFLGASNLAQNGGFVLLENQLFYLPDDDFTGYGTIAVRAENQSDGAVHWATIFLTVSAAAVSTPNDPHFNSQYGLHITKAARAWNLSRGEGINVAVIDSGIHLTHLDLGGNIFTNSGEIPGDGIDNDGNGFIDDVNGWDFTTCETFSTTTGACIQTKLPDNNPADQNGHGTHVAGIVAAESNNGTGVSGIAPDAKLIPIQVLNQQGTGLFSDIINGINYAVAIGARVINMSLGALFSSAASLMADTAVQAMQSAIAAARQAGVVVVAAAGNNNTDAARVAPAALEGVITVSGTNQTDGRYTQSNFGEKIEVAAPAVQIRSTYLSGGYADLTGTSMAAPFVSGLAAMILSQDPTADYDDVLRRLKFSSVDLGAAGFDPYFGWGRIDAFKALSYDYYDNGTIKTQWLEAPDENGWTRLDFDAAGRLIGGSALAGAAGLAGIGAPLVNAIAGLISVPVEDKGVEDFPRLIISPVPVVFSLKVSASGGTVSKESLSRTPLGWSVLRLWSEERNEDRKEKIGQTHSGPRKTVRGNTKR